MTSIPLMTLRKAVHATTWGDTAETAGNNRYNAPTTYQFFAPPVDGIFRYFEEEKRSYAIVTSADRESLHAEEYAQGNADQVSFTGAGADATGAYVRIYITNDAGETKVTKITFNRVSA